MRESVCVGEGAMPNCVCAFVAFVRGKHFMSEGPNWIQFRDGDNNGDKIGPDARTKQLNFITRRLLPLDVALTRTTTCYL